MRLSMFLVNQWIELQASELKHVGVVAYSGGIRDYQIPDDWSVLPNVSLTKNLLLVEKNFSRSLTVLSGQ